MLANTHSLLTNARINGYAVGAFNIYNLEGAVAVVQAAEELNSPAIIQILPVALDLGGKPLVSLCLELAENGKVPISVHLDHCGNREIIDFALDCGFSSVMADGSGLNLEENIVFTRDIVTLSRARHCVTGVEAELGKLSGTEDGVTADYREECLTSPEEAVRFVEETGVDALAVCIGNIHGKYPSIPELDFDRLAAISKKLSIPLVLHGTSGLPDEMITRAMKLGVSKFNVNTEVRNVYMDTLRNMFVGNENNELIQVMQQSIEAMKEPVRSKIKLFCSQNRANL